MPKPLSPSCILEPLEPRRLLAVDVAIDAAQRFQQIDGFGTSMAWWRPGLYEQAAWSDAYYKDLGSSMLRVDLNINALLGADNDPATPVTMTADLQTNINQFNWSSVPTARFGSVIKAAAGKKLDDFKLIGSIWTPPHWMKGVERNPSTGASNGVMPALVENNQWGYTIWDSSGGSLLDSPENLQQFGRYVAAYVKGYEQQFGVPMYALSIANELAFHEPYNSAVYDPSLYVKALKAVGAAFKSYGITTKLIGPEDVGVGSTSDPWVLKRQMKYIDAIRADAQAMADLDLYTIHGYAKDGISGARSSAMWSQYWSGRPQAQYPNPSGAWWTGIKGDGKKSWMTEISGQSSTWGGAMSLAANAQDALVQGNVSAWLYWQMSDSDTTNSFSLTRGADTTTQKYNAAKHFFRYIRPGAVRVSATPSSDTGVYVSAFVQDAKKTLTSVLLNLGTAPETVNISLGGTNLSTFNIARQSTGSALWTDLGPITVSGGVATLTLAPQSIVTLQGAIAAPASGGSIAGKVFNDSDADGINDTGEAALAGWKLFVDANKNGLLDAGEATATSDSAGNYKFTAVPVGGARVRAIIPGGWRGTTPSTGYQDLTVAAGATTTARNIGATQNIRITGTLWNDTDGDRLKETGEPLLANWKVYIDVDKNGRLDAGEPTATTNSAGVYTFDTLKAGLHRVRQVLPAGWRITSPTSGYFDLKLTNGQTSSGRNFGNTQKILISGTVFNDADANGVKSSTEAGLSAWRVFVDKDKDGIFDVGENSVITDSSGNWNFKTLPAGTYVIRVVQQSGWTRTTPAGGAYTVTLSSGSSSTGRLFGQRR